MRADGRAVCRLGGASVHRARPGANSTNFLHIAMQKLYLIRLPTAMELREMINTGALHVFQTLAMII